VTAPKPPTKVIRISTSLLEAIQQLSKRERREFKTTLEMLIEEALTQRLHRKQGGRK